MKKKRRTPSICNPKKRRKLALVEDLKSILRDKHERRDSQFSIFKNLPTSRAGIGAFVTLLGAKTCKELIGRHYSGGRRPRLLRDMSMWISCHAIGELSPMEKRMREVESMAISDFQGVETLGGYVPKEIILKVLSYMKPGHGLMQSAGLVCSQMHRLCLESFGEVSFRPGGVYRVPIIAAASASVVTVDVTPWTYVGEVKYIGRVARRVRTLHLRGAYCKFIDASGRIGCKVLKLSPGNLYSRGHGASSKTFNLAFPDLEVLWIHPVVGFTEGFLRGPCLLALVIDEHVNGALAESLAFQFAIPDYLPKLPNLRMVVFNTKIADGSWSVLAKVRACGLMVAVSDYEDLAELWRCAPEMRNLSSLVILFDAEKMRVRRGTNPFLGVSKCSALKSLTMAVRTPSCDVISRFAMLEGVRLLPRTLSALNVCVQKEVLPTNRVRAGLIPCVSDDRDEIGRALSSMGVSCHHFYATSSGIVERCIRFGLRNGARI